MRTALLIGAAAGALALPAAAQIDDMDDFFDDAVPEEGTADVAGEDELFMDDELDDLFDESGGGTGALDSVLTGFQGFLSLRPRVYLRDRGGVRNDEQFLVTSELELDLRFSEDVTGYLRPRLLIDLLDGDYERFAPFEAYATWESEAFDLRAGSIVENWGVVDTFNPLDVLNRRDFASDLLDADRLGEVGVRARAKFTGGEVIGEPTVSAYVVPAWQATPFAPEDQRFAVGQGPLQLDEDAAFDPSGEDRVFYGLRGQATLSTSLFNADAQVVAAHGPGRFPAVGIVGGVLAPVYFGATTLGAGIRAVPNEGALGAELAKYTLKAEVAHTRTTAYDDAPIAAPDDYTVFVVGVDRIFDRVLAGQDSLTTTVEYARENGASDPQALFRPFRNDLILRALWEANDFARTSLELRTLIDLDNKETIAELVYETQLRRFDDDLKLRVQLQAFDPAGPDESFFGLFPNNSSLLVGLTWDF